ncbi:hypothetical protein B0A49_00417 [Cryomyces minteri]|uniref:Uncharacterized protein n=1 Tax=Cryomyces minteri TaxID=331657 RepID=A0A4U0XWE6_9PEZI|nr:hypothetical protein B0A49_00417 [Cryomyces minteri]
MSATWTQSATFIGKDDQTTYAAITSTLRPQTTTTVAFPYSGIRNMDIGVQSAVLISQEWHPASYHIHNEHILDYHDLHFYAHIDHPNHNCTHVNRNAQPANPDPLQQSPSYRDDYAYSPKDSTRRCRSPDDHCDEHFGAHIDHPTVAALPMPTTTTTTTTTTYIVS